MREFGFKAKLIAIALAAAMLLSGCSANLEQIEKTLEILSENAQNESVDVNINTTTDVPATDEVPAETEEAKEPESSDEEDKSAPPEKDIYILYTSDVHCGVDKGFGYAGLAQIRSTLEAKGYETILVDDGDFVQGEAIGTLSHGEAIIPIMNAMKYDVVIPGNHEFDYGIDQFFRYVELADFPFISCNFNKNGKLVFEPYIIKEAGGKKIAFVGMTTPETLSDVAGSTFTDDKGNYIYGFMQGSGQELYKAVQEAVDAARADGADYVYAMAHLGELMDDKPYTYMDVVANTSGIDVLLDGHSHDTDQVTMKNKDGEDVFRSACGTKLNCIGYSHIYNDEGETKVDTGIWTWGNDKSLPDLLGVTNEIGDLVQSAQKDIEEKLSEVIAQSEVDLTISDPNEKDGNGFPIRLVRSAETNLGDLCADSARFRTGADIGIVNGGGVRVSVEKGDITYGDIMDINPFDNKIVVVEASGQDIMDALEWGCMKMPGESGGFLQVSGISFDVDTSIDSPCQEDANGTMTGIEGKRRVSNVKVGDEPIDPNATYKVAGNSFILTENGNGYTAFDDAKIVVPDAGVDNQLLIDYIVDTLGGTIGSEYADPYGQGRIVIDGR